MSVFGIAIEGGESEVVLRAMSEKTVGFWIVTANPEILLEARKNPVYKKAVQQADYRTIDGIGLYFFEKYVLRRKVARLTGVELSERLVKLAHERGWRVGLIGASIPEPGTAEKAAEMLRGKYSGIQILAEDGGSIDSSGGEDEVSRLARERLMAFRPHILLVAFGHPKQELWIQRHKSDFAELKGIVGVGGTLDFWTGRIKRAPLFMRKIGTEWLWRLFQEPKRFGRIFRAVFVFPVLAVADRLKSS